MKCPKPFLKSEKKIKQALKSRDVSRIEKTISELAPFEPNGIAYMLHHIAVIETECSSAVDTYTKEKTTQLVGTGIWNAKTNIDKCYIAIAMVSFLHKAQKNAAVKAFVKKQKNLHFVGHAMIDLQNFSVLSALQTLHITGYETWNDTYSISGLSGLPTPLKTLQIARGDLIDCHEWKAAKYKKLNTISLEGCHLNDLQVFSQFPSLKELNFDAYQMRDFDFGNVQSFGKNLETLSMRYLTLKNLDFTQMPALKHVNFSGALEGELVCEDHKIESLHVTAKPDLPSIRLHNLPALQELIYGGNTWGEERSTCENLLIENAKKLKSIKIAGRIERIAIKQCEQLDSLTADMQVISTFPHLSIKTSPKLQNLNIKSGGYGWEDPRKPFTMSLDSGKNLHSLLLSKIDWNSKLCSLPDLPTLQSFHLREGIATELVLPNMPLLENLTLETPAIAEIARIKQRTTKAFKPQTGLDFPVLTTATFSTGFQLLQGLRSPKLTSLVLDQMPELQNVEALLDCPALEAIEVKEAAQISPRIPKKNMKQKDVTKFLAKVKRSVARNKKNNKKIKKGSTSKTVKTRSTKSWITFIRKMIKEQNHDSFAELQQAINNMPSDFWGKIFEGMLAANIKDANWYSNRHLPYPRSYHSGKVIVLNDHWGPIKTVLRGVTYHFALYVYYYLLTHAPKGHAFATESFQTLRRFVMTIEQDLKLFSLSQFTSLEDLELGHPQLRNKQVPRTAVDLDALGTVKDVKSLKCIGLSYTAKKLSLPNLETIRMEKCDGVDMVFLSHSPLLKSVHIEDSEIEDFAALPLETIQELHIFSSKVHQSFPGKLLARCKSLKKLVLGNIRIDEFSLTSCTELTNLSLFSVISDTVPNLSTLTKLVNVHLQDVSENLLSMFSKANHVQKLQLNVLPNASLKALSKAKKLQTLVVEDCEAIDGSEMPTLVSLQSLSFQRQQALHINQPQPQLKTLNTSDIQSFSGAKHLPALEELEMRYVDVPLTALYGLFSLRIVKLYYKTEQEINLAPVSSWPNIQFLSINKIAEISDLTPLTALFQLEHLSMNPKVLGNIEVLAQLPKLKTLAITGRMTRTAKKFLPNVKISICY